MESFRVFQLDNSYTTQTGITKSTKISFLYHARLDDTVNADAVKVLRIYGKEDIIKRYDSYLIRTNCNQN